MLMRALPYAPQDLSSIFNYSKQLLHHCLRDFAPEGKDQRGKGGLGQLVEELFFRYGTNSRPEADFALAHAELKCTPLKEAASGDLLIKERLVCGMINYAEDWDKTFGESHFYKKCLTMLIMFYLHQPGVPRLDLHFLFTVLWQLPAKDLLVIRRDYDTIIGKIRAGQAHTLSEGDTMYLGACRKGQKGDRLVAQHNSVTGAPRRAWSLKASYMRTLLQEVKEHHSNGAYCNASILLAPRNSLFSPGELSAHSVDELLAERFAPYLGLTLTELCHRLHVAPSTAKSKYFILANRIAGLGKTANVNRTEEFEKSGLTMKTIRIRQNGVVKESMSFENIDYQEIHDCDEWTESRLYELFTSRFLFVIFRETGRSLCLPNGNTEPEYRLGKVALWTMPPHDLAVAREYWENIRENVLADRISPRYFWSISDNRKFHVRPKASKASDTTANPNGGRAQKYCYWFNAGYIREIVENEI